MLLLLFLSWIRRTRCSSNGTTTHYKPDRKPIAACIGGQSRTFQSSAANIYVSMIRPWHSYIDVFLSLDLHILKHGKRGSDDEVFSSQESIQAISTMFAPVATSLRRLSPNLASSMEHCGKLVRDHEDLRGHKYEWILRLRPDVIYHRRQLPNFDISKPFLDRMRTRFPKLVVVAKLGCADNNLGGCGAPAPLCTQVKHECADDNWALVSRAAFEHYFLTEWIRHDGCHPGHSCHECFLGCTMVTNNVTLASWNISMVITRNNPSDYQEDISDVFDFIPAFDQVHLRLSQYLQNGYVENPLNFSDIRTFRRDLHGDLGSLFRI